ncbi:MAG: hypothetical protein IPK60_02430 [Sandaracinaceae bacterium]|nr:hypothetical protein [Sandaracinaceae bacterium]
MAGRVFAHDDGYIETKVVHVFFLPLLPLASYVVKRETDTAVEIATNQISVSAAFLRSWGPLLFGAAFALPVFLSMTVASPVLSAVGLAMTAGGWFLGRASARTLAEAKIYERVTGIAVDPAALPDKVRALEHRLRRDLDDGVVRFSEDASYRHVGRVNDWRDRALDERNVDRVSIERAFTLARIEELRAETRAERNTWRELHRKLSARLLTIT